MLFGVEVFNWQSSGFLDLPKTARVGAKLSNLSTPAIFKALVERLEPFAFCGVEVFNWQSSGFPDLPKTARVGAKLSNLSTPAIFKALVERLEPFCFFILKYSICRAADSPTYQKQRVLERSFRISPPLPYLRL
ncbi:hypothetical protein ZX61_20400 [Vibrio sp. VPAP30]|nr:hypothetical protein ZX61_20400 [Vibrio sp. VPAP30]